MGGIAIRRVEEAIFAFQLDEIGHALKWQGQSVIAEGFDEVADFIWSGRFQA